MEFINKQRIAGDYFALHDMYQGSLKQQCNCCGLKMEVIMIQERFGFHGVNRNRNRNQGSSWVEFKTGTNECPFFQIPNSKNAECGSVSRLAEAALFSQTLQPIEKMALGLRQ